MAPASSLTKFEARRVRHTCQERANEKALKGKEREEFLVGCIFGRSAQRRAVRRDCRKEGVAKGLDRAPLHDFIHQCAEAHYAGQKPAEQKPVEQKPVEQKAPEQKPAEQKPAEQKPVEQKPAE